PQPPLDLAIRAEQEVDRGEADPPRPPPADQVDRDRHRHAERAEQHERGQELHHPLRAGAARPPRLVRNSSSASSSGRSVAMRWCSTPPEAQPVRTWSRKAVIRRRYSLRTAEGSARSSREPSSDSNRVRPSNGSSSSSRSSTWNRVTSWRRARSRRRTASASPPPGRWGGGPPRPPSAEWA